MRKKEKAVTAKEFNERFNRDSVFRTLIFNDLKTHLLSGYSLDCFATMSEKSIWEAMKNYALEWPVEEFEETVRKAKAGWEQIGRGQAMGTCLGNSRSWYYNMMNRYNWSDKSKVETSGNSEIQVSIIDYSSTRKAQDISKTGN